MIQIKSILLALFFTSICLSQNKSNIEEKYIIQTNTHFYLAGENILYNVNNIHQLDNSSKIVHVELINNENKSVLKHKLISKNGQANNDFFIPTTLETGEYKIVSYTNIMLANSEISSKDIFIVNPYLSFPDKYKIKPEALNLTDVKNSNFSNSLIKTNKPSYSKREKVKFNVGKKSIGNFTISVVKIDSIPNAITSKNNLNTIETNIISNFIKSNPEHRGEVITGKVISKNNSKSAEYKKVALSIPGEYFDFKLTTTDKNGDFKFVLDNLSSDEAYFQIFENDKEDFKIELDQNIKFNFNFSNEKIGINPNFGKAFLKRSIANQIQNIYYQTKRDTLIPFKKVKPFYYGADKEYFLKDFNPQNSVKEIFIEIIPEVYITKVNGKQLFKVFDYEVNFSDSYLNTLVFVDGFLLQDVDEILTFDPFFLLKLIL